MKIYNYHYEYNYLISESTADESPLEPGAFIIPAHATTIQPPRCDNNQIQIFNGSSWDIVDTKRGTYYSTLTFEVIVNDNPLQAPENATRKKPPEVPDGYYLTWNNEWVLEEIPPLPVLTPEEKLARSGLTVEELKGLLGL